MTAKYRSIVCMVIAAAGMNFSLVVLRWFTAQTGAVPEDAALFLTTTKHAGILTALVAVFVCRREKVRDLVITKKYPSIVTFGTADVAGSMLQFVGAMHVPLGLNSLLADLHIVVVPVLMLLLRIEEVSRVTLTLFAISVAGVALLVVPTGGTGHVNAFVALPLMGAACWCVGSFAARGLGSTRPATIQLIVATVGVILSGAVWMGRGGLPGAGVYLQPLFLIAIALAAVAQFSFVASMTAGAVLSALLAAPFFAGFGAIFGWVFFGEAWTLPQWLGAALVLSAFTGAVVFAAKPDKPTP